MHSPLALMFALRRAGLVLLAAFLLGLIPLAAQPLQALACSVAEPCNPPEPGGTLSSVTRVPAGVQIKGNLSIRTKVPATLYGYVTFGPVTTVSTQTRAFDFTIPARAGNQVCVDVTSGGASGSLGCKSLNVSLDPFGAFEYTWANPDGVDIRGWAIDPDTAAPISVQVTWDGSLVSTIVADRSRLDVGNANPGYGNAHGFDRRVPVSYSPGNHNMCVTGVNVGGGATTQIGCRTVYIPPAPNAPTQLTAVSTAPQRMLLTWQYPLADLAEFRIYRADGGPNAPYQWIKVVNGQIPAANPYQYYDNTAPDSYYCYKVRASIWYGSSPDAGPVCAWTQLPAASDVHVTATTDTSLTFSWNDNATHESNNRLVFNIGSTSTYSLGAHAGTGPMSYQVTGLQPGTLYCMNIFIDPDDGRPSTKSWQACGTTTKPVDGGGGSTGGVKESLWWDCVSGHALHIWTFDMTTNGPWQDRTTLNPAFNASGQCGPIASAGYSLTLPDQHMMYIVVVDPQASTCGENNPLNPGCQRMTWQVLGNDQGIVVPLVVS